MKNPGIRFWSRYSREYLYKPRKLIPTASLVTTILIIFLIVFGIHPAIEQIKKKKTSITQSRAKVEALRLRVETIEKSMSNLEESQVFREKLDGYLPLDSSLSAFVEELSLIAAGRGMQITLILATQDAASEKIEGMKPTGLNIEFSGNIQNTLGLIEDLEKSGRFIAITSVKLTTSPLPDDSKVLLTTVIYSLEGDL